MDSGNIAYKPRAYDLTDPEERRRLFREVSGHLHTCRRDHHGTDFEGRQFAAQALDQLRAAEAASPAAGWRTVPIEPTAAMIVAGYEVASHLHEQATSWDIRALAVNTFTAMLKAAPSEEARAG